MIKENQNLAGASSRFGNPIRTYDEGFGDLYVYRESFGVRGIVRAMSWSDAYECVLDEILTPISDDEVIEAYGFYTLAAHPFKPFKPPFYAMRDCGEKLAAFSTREEAAKYCQDTIAREECDLIEGYEYQPNATGSGIVALDLNSEDLRPLTPELARELEITLILETDD